MLSGDVWRSFVISTCNDGPMTVRIIRVSSVALITSPRGEANRRLRSPRQTGSACVVGSVVGPSVRGPVAMTPKSNRSSSGVAPETQRQVEQIVVELQRLLENCACS